MRPPRPRLPLARVLAFVGLFVGLNAWLVRHLGFDIAFAQKLGGVTAAVGAALGLADRFLLPRERAGIETLRTKFWAACTSLLSLPFLGAVALVLLVLMLSVSSVQLLPDAAAAGKAWRLESLSSSTWSAASGRVPAKDKPTRVRVPTTPFGGVYRLSVDGYLPVVLQVPPLLGRLVMPSRELQRTPSILIRLPIGVFASVRNGGRIRVWLGGKLQWDVTGTAVAYALGPVPPIGVDRMEFWKMDLDRSRALDPGARAEAIEGWKSPHSLAGTSTVVPGQDLHVEVTAPSGSRVAAGNFVIPGEEFVDLLLDRTTE